jgi:predicted dehydrogenase
MKELKVGIIGLGWVAGAHIHTFKQVSDATVAAVCSRRKLDEAALEAQYGIPIRVYNDYATMLEDPELDIIDICTPHPFHAEQSIAAAEAGKHLLIEKPIAITFEDAKAMRAAIRKAGVKTCVGFEVRFGSQFMMTKSVIDQGLLGEIHYGEID